MFIISLLQIYAIFHKIARDNTEKTQTFPRHLQIFSRFSFAIEVQREEMRKIIMIKVILVIFGVVHSKMLWVVHLFPLQVVHLKPFPSADGFTLRKIDGTKLLITSANGKTRKQKLTYSQMMR